MEAGSTRFKEERERVKGVGGLSVDSSSEVSSMASGMDKYESSISW